MSTFEISQMKFDLDEAMRFSELGMIEEWIHIFLKTKGDNIGLSDGLKKQRRFWIGPVLRPIDELVRCCGPEEHMEYFNHAQHWEPHVNSFVELVQKGWNYPPLIVEHHHGKLTIRDGNHRHEALKRAGMKECWSVFWDSDDLGNLEKFEKQEIR